MKLALKAKAFSLSQPSRTSSLSSQSSLTTIAPAKPCLVDPSNRLKKKPSVTFICESASPVYQPMDKDTPNDEDDLESMTDSVAESLTTEFFSESRESAAQIQELPSEISSSVLHSNQSPSFSRDASLDFGDGEDLTEHVAVEDPDQSLEVADRNGEQSLNTLEQKHITGDDSCQDLTVTSAELMPDTIVDESLMAVQEVSVPAQNMEDASASGTGPTEASMLGAPESAVDVPMHDDASSVAMLVDASSSSASGDAVS